VWLTIERKTGCADGIAREAAEAVDVEGLAVLGGDDADMVARLCLLRLPQVSATSISTATPVLCLVYFAASSTCCQVTDERRHERYLC